MRLALLVLLLAGGCPAPGAVQRPYPAPTVPDLVARLAKARAELTSFRADSTMDYWLGNQRAKGEVLVMGAVGAKVRFAALSPAGGSTLAEMACDGTNFVYVDYQNNCALTGPCDRHSIEQFFHIELDPDDFVHLAVGTPPVIANPQGKLSWDSSHGYEKLDLTGAEGTQKITLDLKGNHTDVIDSELVGSDGKVRWSVANTDFVDVGGHRLPGKTRFKSPQQQQDLLVEWGDVSNRSVNIEIPATSFQLAAPAGLSMCGQKGAPAAPPASAPPPPAPKKP
jgi:hypothetical protein